MKQLAKGGGAGPGADDLTGVVPGAGAAGAGSPEKKKIKGNRFLLGKDAKGLDNAKAGDNNYNGSSPSKIKGVEVYRAKGNIQLNPM